MKQTLWKRSLSAFLCLAMLLPMIGVSVEASNTMVETKVLAETNTEDGDDTGDGSTGDGGTGEGGTGDGGTGEGGTGTTPDATEYTITFDSNDGSAVANATTSGGKLTSLPTSPTKSGYTFDGWYESSNFSGSAVTSATTFTQDTTVYAKWTEDVVEVTYTITLDLNYTGSTSTTAKTDTAGRLSANQITTPTRTGYTFKEWNLKQDGSGSAVTSATTFTQDTTVYAKWTEDVVEVTYTITLDLNYTGSTSTTAKTDTAGRLSANQITTPTRTGYTFKEWNLKQDGSGSAVTSATTFTVDTTIYAQWEENTIYTITFITNAPTNDCILSGPTTATTDVNGKLSSSAFPIPSFTGSTAEGDTIYSLSSWNTKSDGTGTTITADSTFTGNTTVYAIWKSNKEYAITFDFQDNSTADMTLYTSGFTLATLPTNPSRTGYYFNGWNSKADGTGTAPTTSYVFQDGDDTTFYAQWVQAYTIKFDAGDGDLDKDSSSSATTNVSKKLTSLPTATLEDYAFGGWYFTKEAVEDEVKISTSTVFDKNYTVYARYVDLAVSSVSVSTPPVVKYDVGDKLNLDDLVVKLTWNDGSISYVTYDKYPASFGVSPTTLETLSSSDDTLTITYTDEFDKKHVMTVAITVGSGSYSFHGNIKDHNNSVVGSAKLVLSQGGSSKYSTTSDSNGNYSFNSPKAGSYQLDVSSGDHNLIYRIEIEDGEDLEFDITLTKYTLKTTSSFGTTSLQYVHGLVAVAQGLAQSDTESVTVTFQASNIVSDEEKDFLNYYVNTGDYLVSYMDCIMTVSITDDDDDTENSNLTELSNYVYFNFAIPTAYQDRDVYYVYRQHGDSVDKLTTSSNSYGEKITINEDNTITVQAKYFSTYALGITLTEDDDVVDEDLSGKTVTILKVVNNHETTTVNYGGQAIASDYSPSYGDTVYIDVGANTGYAMTDIFAYDSQKEVIELSRTSTGRFYFKQGYYPVEVTVKFTGTTADTMPEDYNVFPDIPNGEYYTFAVNRMAELELMVGVGDYFHPFDTCSRGMIAVVLYSMAGRPSFSVTGSFTDVAMGDWFYTAVMWAKEVGVIAGYPDGSFRPDDFVTRQEQALMFYNYAKAMDSIDTSSYVATADYTDYNTIAGWAQEAVNWVTANKLFAGAYGAFKPFDVSIRCNLAVSLLGLYNLG